ncbi:MAG: hypothetical protein BGO63_09230 [Candidatus Accumulibacter sp. 66-26]|nr:MAG: hypothetical protein BGO63_09230 [Candidatus Accumulibacter sp. 66-26]
MSDVRWLLLLCLSRAGFALINTVYAALIPLLRPAWSMSASQAGAVQSAWHAGYVVSLVAASVLAGRWGAKRTFLGMGWAACATTLLFALGAHDYASAFLLYGLAGLCAGGSYVPGLTLIAERFPPAARGRAMGAFIAAASLGYALGLLGAGALGGWLSPRAGFLLAAAGTLFGLALAGWTLRATPNVTAPADARRGFSPRATLASLCWLWQHKPARCVILAYAFHAWELLCMWAWLPAFLSAAVALQQGTAGVLPVAGAALAALTHLVSMAGSLAGGSWSDRWGRSRVILLMALSSVACSLVFGWLLAAPLWLLVLVAVFYNFAAVGDSAIYSAALTEVVPGQHLAAAYSLRSVLGFGMGALSPWLFGIVLDAAGGTAVDAAQVSGPAPLAWGLAWSALGAVALVGPWLTWSLMRRRAH